MDLQSYLDIATKRMRDASFESSPQLTLGELLTLLRDVADTKQDKVVYFDFASAKPTDFGSWRGAYAEIALGYGLAGYSGETPDTKLAGFIKEVEAAIGTTYTGWKGGDFTMTTDTPVWVDNSGDANNTGVVGVKDLGWSVLLLTAYCEY